MRNYNKDFFLFLFLSHIYYLFSITHAYTKEEKIENRHRATSEETYHYKRARQIKMKWNKQTKCEKEGETTFIIHSYNNI